MNPSNEYACPACDGDGKCADCNGTGINVHLNEAEPKCRNCEGGGVCPNCGGTGATLAIGGGVLDLGLHKL